MSSFTHSFYLQFILLAIEIPDLELWIGFQIIMAAISGEQ